MRGVGRGIELKNLISCEGGEMIDKTQTKNIAK